ncbi:MULTISPECIES: potassium-transporting ATPase subunit KdpC [unclassified Nocardioides]|jgi:K+-transporting ATPase ATPase C chain|uniref:potassium-transporting ATPase subunit KdpC n=1 Tax=unclassified Nocardioides TaxID=2615069 RepID=UPI000702D713|nr:MULTISPECIES: potassium-transporting ATPase subunit KdpC [unclassified Nocardioides]KRC53508.1 potassium transporter KtrA [Nocardioides sp. Root79]KRC68016.1 potassium transporter KtrA [Nocardioides sp. Root240]
MSTSSLLRGGLTQLVAAARVLAVMTVLLGLAYPLALTGFAQAVVPDRADGSRIERDGAVVGSSLIGQSFTGDAAYFQSRPSAAGDGYDPLASSASNLSPANPDLVAAVRQRIADVAAFDGVEPADVAPDAVLASGSGLDPHISPEYADQQVARVARTRGLSQAQVRELVADHTAGRTLGFLGEPRVNVLELNLALDGLED